MLLLRFAIYPGGASRYIKHVDNTLGTDGRRLTAVLYLNRHWSLGGEGGEKSMETAKPASCDRHESSSQDWKLFELEVKTYWLALGKKVWLWISISPHANTSFERSDPVQSFSV